MPRSGCKSTTCRWTHGTVITEPAPTGPTPARAIRVPGAQKTPSAKAPKQITNQGPGGRRPGAGRPRDPESIQGLRRQKLALEVRRLEIGVALDEQTKVDVAAVCTVIAQRNAACRSRLLALPAKLAPILATMDDPEAVRQVLADGVEEALAELVADAEAFAA